MTTSCCACCEILRHVHYLRELCGANDGQLWRDRMKELMNSEGSSALRRAKLTRSFNNGYRSYSRTYNSCSTSAQTAINRFLTKPGGVRPRQIGALAAPTFALASWPAINRKQWSRAPKAVSHATPLDLSRGCARSTGGGWPEEEQGHCSRSDKPKAPMRA